MASISQSGSLSLFSSKDLELEQRALHLKRLAFVIFCSDEDQYQKQMPEIQGIKFYSIELFSDLFAFYNFRAFGGKFENDSQFSSSPRSRFSLFSRHFNPNVLASRDFFVASNHHGNGANILVFRTRIIDGYGRMEVNYQKINCLSVLLYIIHNL